MNRNLYWLPTLIFLIVGGVYLYASLTMEEAWSGGYQHRLVPLTMSVVIVALCGLLLFLQLTRATKINAIENDSENNESVDKKSGNESVSHNPLLADEFFLKSLPLFMLIVLYALAQSWFGYLLASLLCGVVIFKLFGNSILASVVHSAAITALIYLLFFKLLKLYDPPGNLIDLSNLL